MMVGRWSQFVWLVLFVGTIRSGVLGTTTTFARSDLNLADQLCKQTSARASMTRTLWKCRALLNYSYWITNISNNPWSSSVCCSDKFVFNLLVQSVLSTWRRIFIRFCFIRPIPKVWPFLLGVYPWNANPEEVDRLEQLNERTYQTSLSEWLNAQYWVKDPDRMDSTPHLTANKNPNSRIDRLPNGPSQVSCYCLHQKAKTSLAENKTNWSFVAFTYLIDP